MIRLGYHGEITSYLDLHGDGDGDDDVGEMTQWDMDISSTNRWYDCNTRGCVQDIQIASARYTSDGHERSDKREGSEETCGAWVYFKMWRGKYMLYENLD